MRFSVLPSAEFATPKGDNVRRIFSKSPDAAEAFAVIEGIQRFFVAELEALGRELGDGRAFEPVEWFRDGGVHGGGVRYVAADTALFNRASVNFSQVHYDDDPSRPLGSATAVSTIIHPANPYAPSMHMHISFTEMHGERGCWRIMADLNPSVPNEADTRRFGDAMRSALPEQYAEATRQGERYFYIPALGRHRGVSHFYLEEFSARDLQEELSLAKKFARCVIMTYMQTVKAALKTHTVADEEAVEKQRAYHTLYLLQVLTLDRGTTAGLLAHGDNDTGVLGSLPSHVDKRLLDSWRGRLEGVQNDLLGEIVSALPGGGVVRVDDEVKARLAGVVRDHYRKHPEALSLQAGGGVAADGQNRHARGRGEGPWTCK